MIWLEECERERAPNAQNEVFFGGRVNIKGYGRATNVHTGLVTTQFFNELFTMLHSFLNVFLSV